MKLKWIALCGTVSMLPFTAAAEGGKNQIQQQKRFGDGTCLPSFLEQYDVNEDGVIDEEERQAMEQARKELKEQLKDGWDEDGDGKVCDQERERARLRLREKIEQNRIERFAEADTDGDGFLSYEEFAALPGMVKKLEDDPEIVAAIFDRLDADDDQLVSEEEFLAAVAQCDRPEGSGAGDGTGDGPGTGDGTGECPDPRGGELPPVE